MEIAHSVHQNHSTRLGSRNIRYFTPIFASLMISMTGVSYAVSCLKTSCSSIQSLVVKQYLRKLRKASGFHDPPPLPMPYIQPLSQVDMAREHAAIRAALQTRSTLLDREDVPPYSSSSDSRSSPELSQRESSMAPLQELVQSNGPLPPSLSTEAVPSYEYESSG